ncbi:MAG: NAD(P)H-dependent oxidoreductase [Pseudomonadota bacterium]
MWSPDDGLDMKNVLIINGHQPHPSSPGALNGALADLAHHTLEQEGATVRSVLSAEGWQADREIDNHLWADLIFLQFPLNSMSVPWSLKRYLDEVYTAGMNGRLARGDGRTRSDPSKQYGSGGRMQPRKYALSVTLNAPRSAFGNPDHILFEGRTIDDLLAPVHINFGFFGLAPLPTFAAYDVKKNSDLDRDFTEFRKHVQSLLAS